MAGRVIRVVGAVVGGVLVAVGLLFLVGAVSLYRQFGPSPEMARVDVDLSRPGTIHIPYRHPGSHGEVLRLELIPSHGNSPEMDREMLAGLSARLTLRDGTGAVVGDARVSGADFRLEDLESGKRGWMVALPYDGASGAGLLLLEVVTPAPALSGKSQQAAILEGCQLERSLMPFFFVAGAVVLLSGAGIGWGLWRRRKPRDPAAA